MIKLKSLRDRVLHIKIRTKLLLLILIAGAFCLTLFRFLWHKKWEAYYFLIENLPSNMRFFPMQDNDFWLKLTQEALKYDVPDSEDDKEAVKALEPFFSLADDYTSITVYGLEDGLYRAGCFPEAMLWNEPFNTFFQMSYRWIDEEINQVYERAVKFKNGYASVFISFYHSSYFIVPYALFCLFLCVSLFLFLVLFFVGKKLKTIVRLETSILQMSSGDLETPLKNAGFDEIGILTLELDKLRSALRENFLREQEVHKSNQELIAALSHDLRTPLTILKGYLEILRLNRNPDMQTEYISRCLRKADDLKEMTDRMFEYALVFDEDTGFGEETSYTNLPVSFFLESLKEHSDFLRLAGFTTELCFPDCQASETSSAAISADEAMIKRILNNLFSNIIKYADKKETVSITVSTEEFLVISVKNKIKETEENLCKNEKISSGYDSLHKHPCNHKRTDSGYSPLHETLSDNMGSTQIGLKSVQKMMEKMSGKLSLQTEKGFFQAKLQFAVRK